MMRAWCRRDEVTPAPVRMRCRTPPKRPIAPHGGALRALFRGPAGGKTETALATVFGRRIDYAIAYARNGHLQPSGHTAYILDIILDPLIKSQQENPISQCVLCKGRQNCSVQYQCVRSKL